MLACSLSKQSAELKVHSSGRDAMARIPVHTHTEIDAFSQRSRFNRVAKGDTISSCSDFSHVYDKHVRYNGEAVRITLGSRNGTAVQMKG